MVTYPAAWYLLRCRYDLPDGQVIRLTRQQVQILRCIVAGDCNQEIARSLILSEKTIKNYVSSLLRILHVRNRTEAAMFALTFGIVDLPVIDPQKHPHEAPRGWGSRPPRRMPVPAQAIKEPRFRFRFWLRSAQV